MADVIPNLEGPAADAVAHRGSHVQIIASAGSGKTEVVSQRVAALLSEGQPPESIVAFTFTEKAAAELKERIRQRVTARLGESATDQLGRLFVGTIHAYCFRLLQTFVPRYETYTPLDSNQLVNLLYREASRLGLKQFDKDNRLFRGVATFLRSVDVVENELLDVGSLPLDAFHATLTQYYEMLDGYRFMSFGTQIVRAVEALSDSQVHQKVTGELRHLIVDEYQDVNPAQERLIELLTTPNGRADLVVVGDDDQAIYQWRGSKVSNIVTFADRYPNVAQFSLLANRRSRLAIVEMANGFAQSISGRLPKQMSPHRPDEGPSVSFAVDFADESTEADAIAMDIEQLHDLGIAFRDMAILVRGRVAYPRLLESLESAGIPVQPGGRTGLFEQPEAAVFGATYSWLSDIDWAPGRFIKREQIELDGLLDDYRTAFDLALDQVGALRDRLEKAKERVNQKDYDVSLVGDFYTLLALLGLSSWDTSDAMVRNRLGTIARFTHVLTDYEAVTRRSRRDPEHQGEQVGGQIGDEWFYRNLALLLVNYANGNYDDFDGEEDLRSDGVALGTVHGAKGLEWPIVFLPSLTDGRFPSSKVGATQEWLVPTDLFDVSRYEGSDADERRLFYVAMTRARDWLSLSSHRRVNKQARRPSPYLAECLPDDVSGGHPAGAPASKPEESDLALTYSELDAYMTCPQSYLLRNQLGFMPPIKAELGYGNAVHHLMRVIAEKTQDSQKLPTPREINELLNDDFYLPFANKPAHKQMRENARKLVFNYVRDHQDQLRRTWATERAFELYLPGVVVRGRADVIYDDASGTPQNLTIVDYKTSTRGEVKELQLQVYAAAARREELTVAGAVVHDMSTGVPHSVDVDPLALKASELAVANAAEAIRERDFTPSPERAKCRECDVRRICGSAVTG